MRCLVDLKRIVPIFFLLSITFSFANAKIEPRIVSLSPPVTEELFLLGMGENVIANTIYCQRPKEAKYKEKVGTVVNVNLERIIRLRPDFVFVSPLTDKKAVEKMKRFGINVWQFPHPRDFEEIRRRFTDLSRIVGKEEAGWKIVTKFENEYKKLKNTIPEGHIRPKVFVQLGSNPLFTANKDSILDSFISDAGGENIAKNSPTGFFSLEELILKDPDYILIVGMGMRGQKEMERFLKMRQLRASREKKIFVLDSQRFCSPTLETYVEGVKELREIFLERGRP
ncbi:MAG: helical backbone metal receptor [Desulfobacterota bacterium]|nr:helical backbone metal receptor [Thermodesulfobacteriota bacterium]MDW8002846.1 helical backbone metal receptor [Deltaproteobacteria bacterium]